MAISVRSLSFGYDKLIFDDINVSFNESSISCIFGLNGSGKSTLIELIIGNLKPINGEITVKIDAKLGVVLQFPENLIFCNTVYDEILSIAKSKYVAEQIIKKLNFDDLKGINPHNLSDGQKRMMFIMSILYCYDICIFDEPFTSMDHETKNNIKKMFKDFKNEGKTIVYTTNRRMDTDIADFVLEIK
ncbi:ABC transporter ATP-binding protein [Deferribacteraceae bacterium V6Fe1]|jgi:energy-coupling factor transporter ATP-binding protein EcfA2|uniref:ATP-binding cassette domain-containing protein n=1 Tax=Deferrivibrio essentukiensis TaxID=2880922 RepID=UPI001F624E90|nr:ABC transporter ATP-binding protein [Deferrivibrio essentukiensis]MBZ4672547.1 transporter, ATP-binding protein [Deferribacteraceae bacterium]MCB4205094.1 energy-coupling factor ABC transporter ATP-binding protein [Deferrivibrio essentukiensis]UOD33786.1 ABC transporter ATP-binding protein [Deferribacteraceae bacterium V6Fe1]